MYPRTIIIAATAITISAGTARPQDAQKGQMVFNTQGGRFGGYGFYVLKGKPVFLYNFLDLQRTRWEGPDALSPGKHTLEFDFKYDDHAFGAVCLPCHSIGPSAENKVGPELNGLDGRHSGSAPDFEYSDANKNSGIVWNEAAFKKYIQNPQGVIPGTKMIFPGVKNEQQVNDLWTYVSQFNADGSIKK